MLEALVGDRAFDHVDKPVHVESGREIGLDASAGREGLGETRVRPRHVRAARVAGQRWG